MDKTGDTNPLVVEDGITLSERPAIIAFPASPVLWTIQFLPGEVDFLSAGRRACETIQKKSGGSILLQDVFVSSGIVNLYRRVLGPQSGFGLHEAAKLLANELKTTYAGSSVA